MIVRTAGPADVDAIVETLTSAFFNDPLWGPVFPDESQRARQASVMWRLYAVDGLRFDWLMVTENVEAAAVWTAPGQDELTDEHAAALPQLLADTAGQSVADEILELFHLFEDVRPTEPHCYLSLLGTHDRYRGHGIGMNLLRAGLRRVDELGLPAYLESSNPANNRRYESVGFVPSGGFTAPSGHPVTTMWRPAP